MTALPSILLQAPTRRAVAALLLLTLCVPEADAARQVVPHTLGPGIVRTLPAGAYGAERVALSAAHGGLEPLLEAADRHADRRMVLESLFLHAPTSVAGELVVDGKEPRTVTLFPGGARLDFERPLEPGDDGRGGWLSTSNGAGLGKLPPFTAVLRLGPPGLGGASGGALGLRRFTGFESGELGEFGKLSGAVSAQSVVVRSGSQAMRAQAVTGQYSYATLFDASSSGFVGSSSLDIDELYLSFQFRVADWDQRVRFAEVGGTAGATKVRVELEPDGRISLEDDGLTRRYGTRVLERDRWYRIDLIVGTGTATRLRLEVDGQVEIDVDDANTSSQLTRRVHIGRTSTSGGASDLYYDDVVLSESAHAGNARVVLLAPAGAGSYSEWTGAGSAGLDDWPHDGDATHAESSGAGALTCTLDSAQAAGLSGAVHGVKALAVQRRSGNGFTDSRLRLRSGGTDFDSASGDAGSEYALRSSLFASDPATGAAWTTGALDGLEVGLLQVEDQASKPTRVTALGLAVLYTEPPPQPDPLGLRQFTGLETGDLGEFRKTVGGVSVQSSIVRSGGFALRAQAQPGEYAYATMFDRKASGFGFTSLGIDELHLGFQFRVAAWSQRVRLAEVSGTMGTTKLRIELESDGVLSLKDAGSTRYYGVQPLELDRWYRLELVVGTGTTARLQLAVDGVVELDLTDADTSPNPTRRVHLGRSSSSGGASDFYYDDVVLSEAGHAGDARVLLLTPSGAGSYSEWSGAGSSGLDEWPHDGDLTQAQSSGASALTCALTPTAAAGVSGQVLGVKALAVQRRTGSSTTRSSVRLRSAGSDHDAPSGDGGASYGLRAHVFGADPVTGGAWSTGGLDGLELGLVQTEPQPGLDTRVTSLAAAVLFAP